MNFTQIALFEEANLKCHETFTEMEALKKIQKTFDETIQYKYFMIDLDDYSTVNLKWLAQSIKDAYAKHPKAEKLQKLKLIVMMSTTS